MTKTEKLLARIRNNPKNVHFDDLVNLLLRFGFAMRRNSGSHAVFSYPGYPPPADNNTKTPRVIMREGSICNQSIPASN